MERRDFLKTSIATAGACAIGEVARGQEGSTNMATLPLRAFGDTGVQLSIIGFGGIIVMNEEQNQANRVVAEAIERGVNYFDVAPGYGDAEIKLGPALEPYRKNVFLACKTGQRERAGAESEFNRSLERLRTNYFDLYQLHGIVDVETDVDAVFVKGGVMDMLVEKQKAGQIRHIGFSVHTIEAAEAALDRFDFASVLFPVNFACYGKNDWGPQIMKKAQEVGAARLALKAMARQRWSSDEQRKNSAHTKCWYEPLSDREEASRALRWTLAQPVTAAIPPGHDDLFRMAVDIASGSLDLPSEEEEMLMASADSLQPIFPIA